MNAAQLYIQIAIWSQVLSSVIFIALLVFMWFRWLLPVFLTAQERSNRQIAEAERHRDEMKAALQTLHAEIATAQHDAELIVQRAGDHAEHERQAAIAEATDAGERALQNADKELERARAAARQRLRDELLDRALKMAREDAKQRIDGGLNRRLIDWFVGSLQHAGHG
jgi:F-type H+-transporting ATPase subunit b